MPFFRVDLEREVSRRVDLRQTTSLVVEAPDWLAAKDAARRAAFDENDLCKYAGDWKDDDHSRQASNDEVEKRATPIRVTDCNMPYTTPWLKAMPALEVPDAE